MEFPDLLPERLHHIHKATSDEELLELLKPKTAVFVDFLENALNDEMWSERHQIFIRQSIEWLTEEFYHERLAHHFAKPIVLAMQKHFSGLHQFFPMTLTIQTYQMNSLMVGVQSELFYYQILNKQPIKVDHFEIFKEFIETGSVADIWKKGPKTLITLHKEAASIDLYPFMDLIAETLKRYLTEENVINYLHSAQDEQWKSMRDDCIDYINQAHMGVTFRKTDIGSLAFEFLQVDEKTLDIFNTLKDQITHLITQEIILPCPNLISVDLSHSLHPQIEELPEKLPELDLSMCLWLNEETLKTVIKNCPKLRSLILKSNTHLTYLAWSALSQLNFLEMLDLTGCHQIGDEELKIIIQSVPRLQQLHLGGCSQITDEGFATLSNLTHLDVSRTDIGDRGIIEILSHCPDLRELNLTRCDRITEHSVKQAARSVQTLNLTHCPLTKEFKDKLQKNHPYLTIV